MRPRVRFLVLPWGIFLEGEHPHGDHGLGSLVEFRFKAPRTSYSCITIHLMGVLALEVGYTSATTGKGDHAVHPPHVVARGGGTHTYCTCSLIWYVFHAFMQAVYHVGGCAQYRVFLKMNIRCSKHVNTRGIELK
jgi:hypothetical protein